MARPKKESTVEHEVGSWDEELAKAANEAAAREPLVGSAPALRIKRAKMFLGDEPVEGDRIAVVIVDSAFANAWYKSTYDPDSPSIPDCFAVDYVESELRPHEKCEEKASERCAGCPKNEFGSGARGGKACKNSRRLALVLAGTFDKNGSFSAYGADDFKLAEIFPAEVPPTSLVNFKRYVKQLSEAMRRPPHAVITCISAEPHEKHQHHWVFEHIQNIDQESYTCISAKRDEAKKLVTRPWEKPAESTATAKKPAKNKRF